MLYIYIYHFFDHFGARFQKSKFWKWKKNVHTKNDFGGYSETHVWVVEAVVKRQQHQEFECYCGLQASRQFLEHNLSLWEWSPHCDQEQLNHNTSMCGSRLKYQISATGEETLGDGNVTVLPKVWLSLCWLIGVLHKCHFLFGLPFVSQIPRWETRGL